MAIDRAFFFDQVRAFPFGGKLKSGQVNGMTGILDVWEETHAAGDDRWLAYMLATAFHETAATMQPIKEYGGSSWYRKNYGIEGANPARARRMGNTEPHDGERYFGRGYVQLTWKANYKKMSAVVGRDLVAEPDLALDPKIACKIMFAGMIDGLFTGRKLATYFTPGKTDWAGARAIINGTDRKDLVASYAKAFYAAVSYTG